MDVPKGVDETHPNDVRMNILGSRFNQQSA